MADLETMTLKRAFTRDQSLLTRPEWDEYRHIEIQHYFPWGYKVGNVRKRGRITMHPWVTLRDASGERRLDKPEGDGWIRWVPPEDAVERAKEFGWETYEGEC